VARIVENGERTARIDGHRPPSDQALDTSGWRNGRNREWYTCECDAVNLGSPCHRNRVALAGVRLDCARPQQTRQHIGQRWHCKVPQCEGVYLPGEGCNVCHMHDPSGDR
jgi:hypothetical protein